MERIVILGCCGAGKSTLARKLAEKLGLPLVHLDSVFWKPGWRESSPEEFDAALAAELEKPRWIIDGNYERTLGARLERCDCAVYLDYSTAVCFFSVLGRFFANRGKVRPDMPPGCPEALDAEFLRYTLAFRAAKRKKLLEAASGCGAKTVILKNRREAEAFLAAL